MTPDGIYFLRGGGYKEGPKRGFRRSLHPTRTIGTIHTRSPPRGGLLIWGVLMVLEVILVFLGVVLVVLR